MNLIITFLILNVLSFNSHASDGPFNVEIKSIGLNVYSLSIKRIEKIEKATMAHWEELDNLTGAYMIVKCHETGKAHSILSGTSNFGVSEEIKFECDERKLNQGISFLTADECEKFGQNKIVADACKVQHMYMNIVP